MEKKLTVAERVRALETQLSSAQEWISAERERRASYLPVAPSNVRTALAFADGLKEEHAQGKLTDAERSAVVLAEVLRELGRLWERGHRSGDQGALDEIGTLLEMHLG